MSDIIIKKVTIHFEKDEHKKEFATVEVNDDIWFNEKHQFSKGIIPKFKIYDEIKDGEIVKSLMSRAGACVDLVYSGDIPFDL